MATLSLTLHRKWWVIPSLYAFSIVCRISGYAPDLEKWGEWYAANGFELVVNGKRTRLGAV